MGVRPLVGPTVDQIDGFRTRIYLMAPLDSEGLSIFSTTLYQGVYIPMESISLVQAGGLVGVRPLLGLVDHVGKRINKLRLDSEAYNTIGSY